MQPANLRQEAHRNEARLFLIDGILKETVGEQRAFEGAGSKMTESPSPATWPGSPSLIWGPQEGTPPQPAPGPLSGLPRNAGACSPFPHDLRSRDPRTPPSSGRHCACWWLQTGSWSKEASGIHPLASSAQSTTPDALPAHRTNHLSPWRWERAATKPGRWAHLRPYLPRRCHHLGENLERLT